MQNGLKSRILKVKSLQGYAREQRNFSRDVCLLRYWLKGGTGSDLWPYATYWIARSKNEKACLSVVQLRQDNLAGSLFNMVGFQTNLTYPEQKRVFSLIPGLEQAKFIRYGQMHRNTFIASPVLLQSTLQFKTREDLFFAGQIVGVEGYLGNIATGLLAGINAARLQTAKMPLELPNTTMIGALCYYITHARMDNFQPMKANFGLMPPLEGNPKLPRMDRNLAYHERSMRDLSSVFMRDE